MDEFFGFRSVQWSLLYPLVFPKTLALIRYARDQAGGTVVNYAAPLYYYRDQHNWRRFALLYLLHPALSLFYYNRRKATRFHNGVRATSPPFIFLYYMN
jgi:hypothetical protein